MTGTLRGSFGAFAACVALAMHPTFASARGSSANAASPPQATPAPTSTASPTATDARAAGETIAVRGRVLAIGRGFVVFNDGRALRLREGTNVPRGTTLGSDVRATVDRVRRDAIALERDPAIPRDGEVAIGDLASDYVVGRSAATPAPSLPRALAGREPVVVTASAPRDAGGTIAYALTVEVPANTPPGDDVYVATDRSNFSPSEIRMQRVGARRFRVTVSVAAESHVRYEFTRGTYATVERDRSGGIVEPHAFADAASTSIETRVARWADLD